MFVLPAQITATPAPIAVVKEVAAITDFVIAFGTLHMKVIAIFLAADIVLGISAAIAAKKFNFNQLATFMATGVLPYLFGFAVVEMIALSFGIYGQMATMIIFVAIVFNLLASIISNLATLGVNMPRFLKKAT